TPSGPTSAPAAARPRSSTKRAARSATPAATRSAEPALSGYRDGRPEGLTDRRGVAPVGVAQVGDLCLLAARPWSDDDRRDRARRVAVHEEDRPGGLGDRELEDEEVEPVLLPGVDRQR